MHLFQAQSALERLPGKRSAVDLARALHSLRAMRVFFGRRSQANADVIPSLEGHAWCDATEQQVIARITACRRTAI